MKKRPPSPVEPERPSYLGADISSVVTAIVSLVFFSFLLWRYGACPGPDEFFLSGFRENLGKVLYAGGFQPKPLPVLIYALAPGAPHLWATFFTFVLYALFLVACGRLGTLLLGEETGRWTPLFVAANAQAAVFIYGASSVVWAACFALCGVALVLTGEPRPGRLAAAAVLIFLAAACRLEILLLLPPVLLIEPPGKRTYVTFLVPAAAAGLAWTVFSWRFYGDPLAFVREVAVHGARQSVAGAGFLGYPALLWKQLGLEYFGPLPLALIVGGVWSARKRKEAVRLLLGGAGLQIAFFWVVSAAGGRVFERFFFLSFLLLVPLAAEGALWAVEFCFRKGLGKPLSEGWKALVVALLLILSYSEPWAATVKSLGLRKADRQAARKVAEFVRENARKGDFPFMALVPYHDKYYLDALLRQGHRIDYPDYMDLEHDPSLWRSPRLLYFYYRPPAVEGEHEYDALGRVMVRREGQIALRGRRVVRAWPVDGGYLFRLAPP